MIDWADATDPYAVAADVLRSDGRYGISDSAWAMHLLGLQDALPESAYQSLTSGLPMLRAVKDEHELARLAAAGAAADAAYGEILKVRFAGRRETEVAADLAGLLRRFGHEQVDSQWSAPAPMAPTHTTSERVIEPGDPIVLDFGGLMHGYGSDTSRTVTVGEPTDEVRSVHDISDGRSRPPSRPSAQVCPVRRSTAPLEGGR